MEIKEKFKVGDKVYMGYATSEDKQIKCPDCNGTRKVKVLFSGRRFVDSNCPTCSSGWSGSAGVIKLSKQVVKVLRHEVTAVRTEVNIDKEGTEKIEWWVALAGEGSMYNVKNIFKTRKAAERYAQAQLKERIEHRASSDDAKAEAIRKGLDYLGYEHESNVRPAP